MDNKQLVEKSCLEFMEELSSKNAVPGGGSAAALGGALGVGLSNMVASLTIGKKKYAEVEEEVEKILADGLNIQKELLDLVKADAEVFAPLSKAYGLPKETEEEKAYKEQVLSEASIKATLVPLAIAEKAYQSMHLARRIAEIGSRLAVSDAGCSILFLEAALKAARYNIMINLPLITDQLFVEKTTERIGLLICEAEKLVKETENMVAERL